MHQFGKKRKGDGVCLEQPLDSQGLAGLPVTSFHCSSPMETCNAVTLHDVKRLR